MQNQFKITIWVLTAFWPLLGGQNQVLTSFNQAPLKWGVNHCCRIRGCEIPIKFVTKFSEKCYSSTLLGYPTYDIRPPVSWPTRCTLLYMPKVLNQVYIHDCKILKLFWTCGNGRKKTKCDQIFHPRSDFCNFCYPYNNFFNHTLTDGVGLVDRSFVEICEHSLFICRSGYRPIEKLTRTL